mgnify:CR=1 FL=1
MKASVSTTKPFIYFCNFLGTEFVYWNVTMYGTQSGNGGGNGGGGEDGNESQANGKGVHS